MGEIPMNSVSLIFSSPPYNIGKSYEKRDSLSNYLAGQRAVILALCQRLKPGGSLCWQVGNYVLDGEITPLDLVVHQNFVDGGLVLQKRFVWTYGHGLHCQKRFSGRYETVSWYTRGQIEPISVPATYPFLVNEWRTLIMDIPNVKSNHIEKTEHPCQFPVELVERFVVVLTKQGDVVLDPYCGSGSAVIAAVRHGRRGIGIDILSKYIRSAESRVNRLRRGVLGLREMGTRIHQPSSSDKVATKPSSWQNVLNASLSAEDEFPFTRTDRSISLDAATAASEVHRAVPEKFSFIAVKLGKLDASVVASVLPHVLSKTSNICLIFDHGEHGFNVEDCLALQTFSDFQTRNRIVMRTHDRDSFSSVLWMTTGEYYFDLDAVRVPSKYPGKRSSSTGNLSGNPLGKNPSDVWRDCCGKCDYCFGLGLCHWKRLLRALSSPGDTMLLISTDKPATGLYEVAAEVNRSVFSLSIGERKREREEGGLSSSSRKKRERSERLREKEGRD